MNICIIDYWTLVGWSVEMTGFSTNRPRPLHSLQHIHNRRMALIPQLGSYLAEALALLAQCHAPIFRKLQTTHDTKWNLFVEFGNKLRKTLKFFN